MKIIHRISLVDEKRRRETLASLGIKFGLPKNSLAPILWFDIDECDSAWNQLRQLLPKWNIEDGCDPKNLGITHTEFTSGERDAASFLQLFAFQKGYPQSANDFGYLQATYDLSNFCRACGMGKSQMAPFRMKGEPSWGKIHVIQLNWVFDEFFVLPQVWETVFKPLGVGYSVVLNHRTGKPLSSVVQLVIKNVASSALIVADYPWESCGSCGRKKHLPVSRGFFPPFAEDPTSPICKTQESFGSGASAWNATIIRSDVCKAILNHKLVGTTFIPLKNVGAG